MGFGQPRPPPSNKKLSSERNPSQEANMSILAMTPPSPHSAFRTGYPLDGTRPSPPRSHYEPQSIALPSIRQAFPELRLSSQHQYYPIPPLSTSASPVANVASKITSPEYLHSPNKRQRNSTEDEAELARPRQVSRLYASPEPVGKQQNSPTLSSQPATVESRQSSGRHASPFARTSGFHPPHDYLSRPDLRPSLPSLPPPLGFEKDHPSLQAQDREQSRNGFLGHHIPTARQSASTVDTGSEHQGGGYGFAYQHPSRLQSLSTGSIRPYDRSPFTAGGYGGQYQEAAQYNDAVGMSLGGDTKQRKRRGNLPKETTDKLRAWFLAHLHHPYPSEDEKQELMRQTGLQMNQISNWFINARRRQLPAMINNARAESDAMNAHAGEGKILVSPDRALYGRENAKMDPRASNDIDSGVYDDDLDNLGQRNPMHYKRGSV
ncbi:hypothetical protein S40285_00213 [Stachybotrys chlorohalonatus IBT 40285]|uniref:Homeobox domain-containing protein n=1 Tax=Stachybotrys chlorohalonatus (strain IBT 40285) TaxID=1283841 RepID=A0A084QTX2_STAC4|nr:hypothetical protein S40285_00213 [Stachybotrys chlorohalonata IBT 40285]